jgi:hypothetical protein
MKWVSRPGNKVPRSEAREGGRRKVEDEMKVKTKGRMDEQEGHNATEHASHVMSSLNTLR